MFSLRIVMMAVRSLRQNLMRSILATLGVIIGVGAVVSAVSILEGAQRDILQRFETLGADQVLVFNGSDSHSHRRTQGSFSCAIAQAALHENWRHLRAGRSVTNISAPSERMCWCPLTLPRVFGVLIDETAMCDLQQLPVS